MSKGGGLGMGTGSSTGTLSSSGSSGSKSLTYEERLKIEQQKKNNATKRYQANFNAVNKTLKSNLETLYNEWFSTIDETSKNKKFYMPKTGSEFLKLQRPSNDYSIISLYEEYIRLSIDLYRKLASKIDIINNLINQINQILIQKNTPLNKLNNIVNPNHDKYVTSIINIMLLNGINTNNLIDELKKIVLQLNAQLIYIRKNILIKIFELRQGNKLKNDTPKINLIFYFFNILKQFNKEFNKKAKGLIINPVLKSSSYLSLKDNFPLYDGKSYFNQKDLNQIKNIYDMLKIKYMINTDDKNDEFFKFIEIFNKKHVKKLETVQNFMRYRGDNSYNNYILNNKNGKLRKKTFSNRFKF
jgi:hypothetical protein